MTAKETKMQNTYTKENMKMVNKNAEELIMNMINESEKRYGKVNVFKYMADKCRAKGNPIDADLEDFMSFLIEADEDEFPIVIQKNGIANADDCEHFEDMIEAFTGLKAQHLVTTCGCCGEMSRFSLFIHNSTDRRSKCKSLPSGFLQDFQAFTNGVALLYYYNTSKGEPTGSSLWLY